MAASVVARSPAGCLVLPGEISQQPDWASGVDYVQVIAHPRHSHDLSLVAGLVALRTRHGGSEAELHDTDEDYVPILHISAERIRAAIVEGKKCGLWSGSLGTRAATRQGRRARARHVRGSLVGHRGQLCKRVADAQRKGRDLVNLTTETMELRTPNGRRLARLPRLALADITSKGGTLEGVSQALWASRP